MFAKLYLAIRVLECYHMLLQKKNVDPFCYKGKDMLKAQPVYLSKGTYADVFADVSRAYLLMPRNYSSDGESRDISFPYDY